MIFLRSLERIKHDRMGKYPYHMASINALDQLSLNQPVTFFIGENGSGKTTLLETLMILTHAIDLIPESHQKLDGAKQLAKSFKVVWNKKIHRGFYLKSQSFISFVENVNKMKDETRKEYEALMESLEGRSVLARQMASQPYLHTLSALEGAYGDGLDKMSHGEGYLELFKSRLVPGGLYILDEPELSLSPTRQLALISLMKSMIAQSCQFIIITHSPILMAYENAVIYEFNDEVHRVNYGDIEHVQLTRDFLIDPKKYLRHL